MPNLDSVQQVDPDLYGRIQQARSGGMSDDEIVSYIHGSNTTGAQHDQMVLGRVLGGAPSATPPPQAPTTPSSTMSQPMPSITPHVAPVTDPSTGKQIDMSALQQHTTGTPVKNTGQSKSFLQKAGDTAVDWLPTIGSVVGGIGGGLLGEGVGAIPGAAAGGAAGEALKEKIQGQDLSGKNIATQGVLGGVGEGAGAIVGKVAGKVLPAVGGKLVQVGEDYGIKGLNLTGSQLGKYATKFGETVGDTLKKYNLLGHSADEIATKGITPLQNQFDNIVGQANVKVNPSIVVNNAEKVISALRGSGVDTASQLADKIEQQFLHLVDAGKLENPSIQATNAIRKSFDEYTKSFANDPVTSGVNRAMGTIFRQSTQDAAEQAGLQGSAGQSLKALGQDLNKLYTLHDMASARQFVGQGGSKVLNLLDLVSGALGGSIGGLPGAAAAIAGGKLASNPKVIALMAKGAMGAGEKIAGQTLSPLATSVTGQAIAQGGNSLINGPSRSVNNGMNNEAGNKDQNNTHIDSLPQGVTEDNSGNVALPPLQPHPINKITQQQYMDAKNQFAGNPVAQAQIDAEYGADQAAAKEAAATNGLSNAETDFLKGADQTNYLLNEARQLIKEVGTNPLYANKTLSRLKSIQDPKYAQLQAILSQIRNSAEKSSVGGRLSNFDIAVQGGAIMPSETDTVEAALAKLNQAHKALAHEYVQKMGKYGMTSSSADYLPPIGQ